MTELTVTHRSSAPPDVVWAVMTDIEGSADVLTDVTGIERLDDGDGFGPGLRWRETRLLFGKEATEEMEVTEVDGRSYVVEAESRGTHYRSRMAVLEDGDGSQLKMSFGAVPQGRLGRLMARTMGRAFEGATRKALEQDLQDIAAAAEARTGTTPEDAHADDVDGAQP